MESQARRVAMFTRDSGYPVPNRPIVMDKKDVKFIIKMVLDEMAELGMTQYNDFKHLQYDMMCMVSEMKERDCETKKSRNHTIAEQADALVDANYYMLNAAAKHGINLDPIFDAVHDANMAKKVDGKFIKREDGKIMKPDGWKAPNVEAIIKEQSDGNNGFFEEV